MVWSPPPRAQRAFFRQKRDTAPGAPEEFVEGEAEVIEYDGRKDDVRLIRRAQLRRYTGGKLSDDITGQQITYNNLTDVFTVDSQTPQAGNKPGSNSGGRVRRYLAPESTPFNQPGRHARSGRKAAIHPATDRSARTMTQPQEPSLAAHSSATSCLQVALPGQNLWQAQGGQRCLAHRQKWRSGGPAWAPTARAKRPRFT